MLLLKDYKIFWNSNFLSIYEVRPPLKQVSPEKIWLSFALSPEKNLDIKFDHQKQIRLSNGITRKQPWFFLVITFESLIFFRWSTLMSKFFSADNATESHIFFLMIPVSKGVGLRKLTKNLNFKKSCSLWLEAYLLMKST